MLEDRLTQENVTSSIFVSQQKLTKIRLIITIRRQILRQLSPSPKGAETSTHMIQSSPENAFK